MARDSRKPEERAREKIDKQLEHSGWTHLDKNQMHGTGYREEVDINQGKRSADYVLYLDEEPVAIIEAKKSSADPMKHRQQAVDYARDINDENQYGGVYSVPFVFVSNGDKIVIEDIRKEALAPRRVHSFYSPKDIKRKKSNRISGGLEYLRNQSWKDIDEELWENQQKGMEAVKQGILDRKSQMLLSMATGSGKTRLSMALSYQLLESGLVSRILFVPDTSELRRSGLEDFKNYQPINSERLSDKYIVGNFDDHMNGNCHVVVDTIQKVRRRLDTDGKQISVGDFDIVIADECHRGVHNDDGLAKALDYFDATEIGLTATPHEKTLNRYNNNHIYSYDYEKALDDGRVVPFYPRLIQTEITMDGYTHKGRHYSPRDIGRKITIDETNKLIARELANNSEPEDELTLVFAQGVKHAENIERNFTEVFKDELDLDAPNELVCMITGENRNAKRKLTNFRKSDRNPRVAVTVDMVSTGVDIKPLNNIVFMRSVKSPILFNQMMGRGTRQTPRKTGFKAFDCVGVFNYHQNSVFTTEDITVSTQNSTTGIGGDGDTTIENVDDENIDRIVNSEEGYPIRKAGVLRLVEGDEFIQNVANSIDVKADEIRESISNCESIESADSEIEEVLTSECQFFLREYIIKASDSHNTLFSLCYTTLNDEYSLKSKARKAGEKTMSELDISEENRKWIQGLEKRAALDKSSISRSTFLNKPLSNHGGYDAAKEIFGKDTIDDIIQEFNSEFLDL